MNTFLLVLTLLSLGFTLAMLALNWSLLRKEHRRSEARVRALMEAAAEPAVTATTASIATPTPNLEIPLQVAADEPVVVAQHELFHTSAAPPQSFRRLALPISLGIAIVGTILSGLAMWSHDHPKAARSARVEAAAIDDTAPLELTALRYQQTADGLSITGAVRNPPSGHRMADVDVLVFLFDRSGAFLTSVTTPLDFRTLAPGDESPFVVSLAKVGPIGRYRVSFKADNKVVPHVDRRQAPVAVASSR